MSIPNNAVSHHDRHRSRSIREELEMQARIQNPELARRLDHERVAGRHHPLRRPDNRDESLRRIRNWQDRVLMALIGLLLLLVVTRTASASANEPVWGLQLFSQAAVVTELAVDTDIQLDITGLVARVEITQRFTNHGADWAEGIYRFPLPDDAAVDRLRIKVGERLLEGEIQEKEVARMTYDAARDAGQTATLVEQQRRNQFETRLANIGPGEAIEIRIGYLQNVSYADSSYHLRLPMTFTPRWEPGQASTAMPQNAPGPALAPAALRTGHRLTLHATLVSATRFAAIESRYHDVDIRQTGNGYTIDLLNPGELTDRDFELSWTPALQSRPSVALTTYNDGESVFALLMLAPPLTESIEPQAREVILVIDTSGSMEGDSLMQAKAALLHALNSLASEDYFNLLQFNSGTELLFDRSVPVAADSLGKARKFINRLNADGGTEMAPALSTALGLPAVPQLMRQVVFVTDGAVGNEAELLQQVASDLGDSRMFTVAIGHAPNSWFMRKTAEIGRGSFVHIGKPEEVAEQMSALWDRIKLPALTDICVDWGGSTEYYPEVIPDLYAGEPLWLLARLPAEPTMIGLCGNLNGEDWNLNVNGWDAVSSAPGDDNLAKLWARKKVEALEDGLMFGADAELTKLEITGVAMDYGLLTRHTSLVAVDRTPRRSAGESLARANVPGLLPAGGSIRLAGYPDTATGWLAQLLLSLFVLLLSTAMLVFSSSRLPMTKPSSANWP